MWSKATVLTTGLCVCVCVLSRRREAHHSQLGIAPQLTLLSLQ